MKLPKMAKLVLKQPHKAKLPFCQLRGHTFVAKRKTLSGTLAYCLQCNIEYSTNRKCSICKASPRWFSSCLGCKKYIYAIWKQCSVCGKRRAHRSLIFCGKCAFNYNARRIRHVLELKAGFRAAMGSGRV